MRQAITTLWTPSICALLCVWALGGCVPDKAAGPDDELGEFESEDPTPDKEDPLPEDPLDPRDPPKCPEDDPVTPAVDCVSNKTFFVQQIWTPILATDCLDCHNKMGQAALSKFLLVDSYETGFLDTNLITFAKMATYSQAGTPTLLIKPVGGDGHGGGIRFEEGSPQFVALEAMLARLDDPVECEEVAAEYLFHGVEVLDLEPTLRKARMVLTSRMPDAAEVENVAALGEEGLDQALDLMMEEPEFFRWLKEVYNDVFLTNAYAKGTDAVDVLSEADFPDKTWHQNCNPNLIANCAIEEFKQKALDLTNWSVSQDVLELVAHVVQNDFPFTDILTADYMMVNPFSAKTFGASNVFFNDPLDENEFRPAQLVLAGGDEGQAVAYPHAGVLTSPMWLHRFPTTATNVNRHRSRMVYLQFLATDVLKLAERAVDQATIVAHNPTLNEIACATCHVIIDPVAGAFQNWDPNGYYRPPANGWYPEMRPPGFVDEVIGPPEALQSLQWLAVRVAGDQRFVISTVHTMFKALTGMDPLSPPTDPEAENYALHLNVYLQQDEYFKEIGDVFSESNYNLKSVIRTLIKSPYFRARQVQGNLEELAEDPKFSEAAHEISLEQLGTSRLLTPEELDRKISTVTGTDWNDPETGENWLLGPYRIYYGGIDFATATDRITEMNGTMANIAERMANELSCHAVPGDFMKPVDERHLFPFVEYDYAPIEEHGFAVPEMDELIKVNILYLYEHLLNEVMDMESPEFERAYNLFISVLKKGQSMLENGLIMEDLPEPCQLMGMAEDGEGPWQGELVSDPFYTVRSWMAVVSYMLADYRFLYH